MRLGRRAIFLGTLAIAGVAAATPFLVPTPRMFRRILARNFAPEIVDHPETDAFLASITERWRHPEIGTLSLSERFFWARHWIGVPDGSRLDLEEALLRTFLAETTVISTEETGADFLFLGPFDPLQNPCTNPISDIWS